MATADRRRAGSSRGLPVVTALAALCAMILVAAPTAIAATSAVCDQYPDLPQCQAAGGTGGGGQSVGGGGDGAVKGGAGPGSSAGAHGAAGDPVGAIGGGGPSPGPGQGAFGSARNAGELPFTGYPLTPPVLLFLILLAGGIAARAYILARNRLAVGRPGHSS
jgi:hypothetical protein